MQHGLLSSSSIQYTQFIAEGMVPKKLVGVGPAWQGSGDARNRQQLKQEIPKKQEEDVSVSCFPPQRRGRFAADAIVEGTDLGKS